jgi:hypothetical protein
MGVTDQQVGDLDMPASAERIRHVGWGCLLCLALVSEALAGPGTPSRTGFTMELGIGVGGIQVGQLNQYGKERLDWGFEPHAISFGGFIENDVAIIGRWKSTYHFTPNSAGEEAHRFLGTLAAHVQWWFRDQWFVAGGAGIAAFGYGIGSAEDDPSWQIGGAVAARIGYALIQWEHHAIKVSFEAVAGFFSGGAALGETLNLEWQYY